MLSTCFVLSGFLVACLFCGLAILLGLNFGLGDGFGNYGARRGWWLFVVLLIAVGCLGFGCGFGLLG